MSKAGDSMVSPADPGGVFLDVANGYVSTPAGWVIAAVWAAGSVVVGSILLRRRDA
jgi:hypothetical protein